MTDADSGSDDDEQITNPKPTYTITFDSNGGTGSIDSVSAIAGTEIELPTASDKLTNDELIFAGWATSADGNISYADKAKITVTGNITLYAKYGMTVEDAVSAISTSADGEECTIIIAGDISEALGEIADAIKNNYYAKIILDLGGATGLTEIPNQAFANCFALKSITVPDSVTSIGEQSFYSCTSLLSVNIPDSVTSIGKEAFAYCFDLKTITIPDSVASIGDGAFKCCSSLTVVNIPDGVTSIGNEMFFGCGCLTSIVIPSSVTSIGRMAFTSCGLISVTIPYGVISIGDNTFTYCHNLTDVSIPASVTSIGDYMFYDCVSLTTVNYGGTQKQWEELINGVNIYLSENATVSCTDGDI